MFECESVNVCVGPGGVHFCLTLVPTESGYPARPAGRRDGAACRKHEGCSYLPTAAWLGVWLRALRAPDGHTRSRELVPSAP